MLCEQALRAGGAVHQFAAAVRAGVVERLGARSAESAFEAADERAGHFCRQVAAAAFAIGAQLQAHAAAFTASQMLSTTCSTCAASSPSAMTRILGSVPD